MNTLECPPKPGAHVTLVAPLDAARSACSRIAPLWPLQDFVAVNPFLGMTGEHVVEASHRMRRLVEGGMQMSPDYYLAKVDSGGISEEDVQVAISRASRELPPEFAVLVRNWTPAMLRSLLAAGREPNESVCLTVAESVDRQTGSRWSELIVESIGQFCAAYLDVGQSTWVFPWKGLPLFQAWREFAAIDASLELQGLDGFRSWVAGLPETADETLAALLPRFGVHDGLTDLLHKQLLTVRGWAGNLQYRDRERSMVGAKGGELLQLLAVRIAFDAAILSRFDEPRFREFWPDSGAAEPTLTAALHVAQLAEERAWQRHLFQRLAVPCGSPTPDTTVRPEVQAVFCIDVRSETFRRAIEAVSPGIQTLGFAGFFGLPIECVPVAADHAVSQCPVLLRPKYRVAEGGNALQSETGAREVGRIRFFKRMSGAWKSFRSSAISSFSYVESMGLASGAALVRDTAAGWFPGKPADVRRPLGVAASTDVAGGIPLADRVELAAGLLQNTGLVPHLAPLVLLCGHGSTSANNPHAAGLDCGACGGHAGDVNARVGAALLNDPAVRQGLAGRGIHLPADTWFVAGLHNTTTDDVTLFGLDAVPASHVAAVERLRGWLSSASHRSRRSRAALLGLEPEAPELDAAVRSLAQNWSEVRPEWGLAGNAAFIAAPRGRTRGVDLAGRVFLHDYDHRTDPQNRLLETILTAPVVVASWINLQYYGSTVNNALFGAGNKALHNVVGGFGVCLGNGGDLQTGLPMQSLHNGQKWMHEPLRLHVMIEAPRARVDAVLAAQAGVRELVDNGWVLLFVIDPDGGGIYRRTSGGVWERGDVDR